MCGTRYCMRESGQRSCSELAILRIMVGGMGCCGPPRVETREGRETGTRAVCVNNRRALWAFDGCMKTNIFYNASCTHAALLRCGLTRQPSDRILWGVLRQRSLA